MSKRETKQAQQQSEERSPYKTFAAELEGLLEGYRGDLTKIQWRERQTDIQNQQVVSMIAAEREFLDALAEQRGLRGKILRRFVADRQAEGRLSSTVRPYFRERNLVFVRELLPAIEEGRWQKVPDFATNWHFVVLSWSYVAIPERLRTAVFAAVGRKLDQSGDLFELEERLAEKLLRLTKTISALRHDLVITNLPLVVDRANAFRRVTPPTPLVGQMDLISVATEGWMCGIDKVMVECRPAPHWPKRWHPVNDPGIAYWRGQSVAPPGEPFEFPEFVVSGFRVAGHHTAAKHVPKEQRPPCPASVFRTTAIGRMGARLIQSYSQTHMHLGPDDRRTLYQCNRVASKHVGQDGVDYGGVATHVLQNRVAFTLAKRFHLDPGELSEEIGEALQAEVGAPDQWAAVGLRLEAQYEGAEGAVRRARVKAPSPEEVASLMLACSTVSTVDEEGEDRLNEAASYSAPDSSRPDVVVEAHSTKTSLARALQVLTILDRKVLVLLGLAPLDCLQPLPQGA